MLESILTAAAENAHQHRNLLLPHFDVNSYNLLLRHYCEKRDWPSANSLFDSMLHSVEGGDTKPQANYVGLILISELAESLGRSAELKISDEALALLKMDSMSAVDSWMVTLYELRLWQQLELWISRSRNRTIQGRKFPVHLGPLGGEAALRRLSKYTKLEPMLRFAEILSKERELSIAEVEVVARELQKRNHFDAPGWLDRLQNIENRGRSAAESFSSTLWKVDRLSEVARSLATQRGHLPLDRFDKLISKIFFDRSFDSQTDKDLQLRLIEGPP